MKRLFTLSLILVTAGLLLPACGTHMTVAKRQHSNGYYVHISSDKKNNSNQADKEKTHEIREELALQPAPVKAVEVETVAVQETASAETEALTAEASSEATENAVVTEEKTQHAAAVKTNGAKEKTGFNTVKSTVKNQVKKFTQTDAKQSKFKKMESRQAASGLSLFWIVILVLLILWLLGLIGGLGGFIYIALIAAIILLILWLLGIV